MSALFFSIGTSPWLATQAALLRTSMEFLCSTLQQSAYLQPSTQENHDISCQVLPALAGAPRIWKDKIDQTLPLT